MVRVRKPFHELTASKSKCSMKREPIWVNQISFKWCRASPNDYLWNRSNRIIVHKDFGEVCHGCYYVRLKINESILNSDVDATLRNRHDRIINCENIGVRLTMSWRSLCPKSRRLRWLNLVMDLGRDWSKFSRSSRTLSFVNFPKLALRYSRQVSVRLSSSNPINCEIPSGTFTRWFKLRFRWDRDLQFLIVSATSEIAENKRETG